MELIISEEDGWSGDMVSIVNSQHCSIQMQNSTYLSLEALMSACPNTLLSLEAALVKSKEATGLTRWAALCSGLPCRARCREALSLPSLEGSNAGLFGDSSFAFCLTVRPAEAGPSTKCTFVGTA